jgi:hypothetical protein
MSRYLARLQRLLAEERAPAELTELTEGAFVGFVSDQGSPFCEDESAIEERAALAADRVPACFLDAWSRINHQKLATVSEAEWRLAIDDGGRFLDAWGADAAAMRWTPGELLDVPRDGRQRGLIWQLKGDRVDALGEDRVRLAGGRTIKRGV